MAPITRPVELDQDGGGSALLHAIDDLTEVVHASIHPGRPSRSRAVTVPVMPPPGQRTHRAAGLIVTAAARMARASGCSLRDSRAAATSITSSGLASPVVATSITSGRLRVSVPVLSRATVRIGAQRLECSTTLDEDAHLAGGTDRCEDGDGHRDRQGARRGCHEYDEGPLDPQLRVAGDTAR